MHPAAPTGNFPRATTAGTAPSAAVEGCEGIGRHVAQRLLADHEPVVECSAVSSGALPNPQQRPVVSNARLEVLRLLVDRRRRIGQENVTKICQLHQLLLGQIPGGAKKDLSAAQARRLLAAVTPTGVVQQTRHRVAMELVEDLERIYQRCSPHRRNDLDRAKHLHTINSGGTENATPGHLTQKGAKSGWSGSPTGRSRGSGGRATAQSQNVACG